LDERVALENFLGKDVEGAIALFRDNDLFYISDLMWMGDYAFRYYFLALNTYIQRESEKGLNESGDSVGEVCVSTIGHIQMVLSVQLDRSVAWQEIRTEIRACLETCLNMLSLFEYIPRSDSNLDKQIKRLLERI